MVAKELVGVRVGQAKVLLMLLLKFCCCESSPLENKQAAKDQEQRSASVEDTYN
jgi:hypothetical protein